MMDYRDYLPKQINGKRVASTEYRAWQLMKNRCLNPNAGDWPYYGGRGITVYDEWMTFEAFFRDMGPKPDPSLTLERRNPNEGYSPENCYWATRKEQARNRRFIKRYRGKTTWEWADELGIEPMSFHQRLWKFKNGLISEEQLFSVPKISKKPKSTIDGKTYEQWAEELGLSIHGFKRRLYLYRKGSIPRDRLFTYNEAR